MCVLLANSKNAWTKAGIYAGKKVLGIYMSMEYSTVYRLPSLVIYFAASTVKFQYLKLIRKISLVIAFL